MSVNNLNSPEIGHQQKPSWQSYAFSSAGGEADNQENDSFWRAVSAADNAATAETASVVEETNKIGLHNYNEHDQEPASGVAGEEFGFDDFVDIVNPLQHLPVISTFYREISGDQISPLPRLLGGTLYGGPVGAGVAMANVLTEEALGQDFGASVLSMFNDTGSTPVNDTVVAAVPAVEPVTKNMDSEQKPVTATDSGMSERASSAALSAIPVVNSGKLDAFIAKHSGKGGFDPASTRLLTHDERRPSSPNNDVANDGASNAPPLPPSDKGADDGQISNWMMQTLDRYQKMKENPA